MPKIRREYEVPADDCMRCRQSRNSCLLNTLVCILFNDEVKRKKDGKYHRCQPCIDAEVKEGG